MRPRDNLVVPMEENRDGPVEWHPHQGSPHMLIWGPVGSGKSDALGAIREYLTRFPSEWRALYADTSETIRDVLEEAQAEIDRRFEILEDIKRDSYSELNMARARNGEEPLPRVAMLLDDVETLAADPSLKALLHNTLRVGGQAGVHFVLATKNPEMIGIPHLDYAAKLPLHSPPDELRVHDPSETS